MKHRQVTAHDLAFGIGRSATKAELKELLSQPSGKGKDAEKVLGDLRIHLDERASRGKALYF